MKHLLEVLSICKFVSTQNFPTDVNAIFGLDQTQISMTTIAKV